MLSWSSNQTGVDIDLTVVAATDGGDHADAIGNSGAAGNSEVVGNSDGVEIALDHGAALLRFATACAQEDDDALATARAALVDDTDTGFMVDAAAVAANFEMMTRLADGTGSRIPAERLERSAAAIGAMGVGELTSRR